MKPGTWEDGVFPPAGITILESGVYCIQDGFELHEGQVLEGNGVVFLIEDGNVKFSGYAQYDLSAPKSGANAGLLMFVPTDNHGIIALNGSDESKTMGTILAPGAEVRLNGLDSMRGRRRIRSSRASNTSAARTSRTTGRATP